MTDSTTPPAMPRPRRDWLKWALVASLAVNLLFIGAGAARFIAGGGPERYQGASQMQLIPRKFFGELGMGRRKELLGVVRGFDPAFREGRRAARGEMLAVADALDAEPYDPAKLKAAVDAFSARNASLSASGAAAALDLIGKLDPDERRILARHIRQRGDRGRN